MSEVTETKQPATATDGWSRLKQQLPFIESLFGALVLDALDVFDVPVVSWWYGVPASLIIGYWLSTLLKFPFITRIALAIMAAVYFVLPGTELVPLATIAVTAAKAVALSKSKTETPPALPQ